MKTIKLWILLSLVILPSVSFGTVDFLAANPVTKELYVFEDSQYMGIFWEAVAGEETLWQQQEKMLLSKGYSYTSILTSLITYFGQG